MTLYLSLSVFLPVSMTLFVSLMHLDVHLCVPVSPCSCPCLRLSPYHSICLISSSGAIQSFAGFADYFTAMAQEGWFPLLCVGLRPQWEDHHLQDLQDSYGQEWVSPCLPMPSQGSLVPSATCLGSYPRCLRGQFSHSLSGTLALLMLEKGPFLCCPWPAHF
jgi:hypothetical protein